LPELYTILSRMLNQDPMRKAQSDVVHA